jgi:L-ascorbate peroxidase
VLFNFGIYKNNSYLLKGASKLQFGTKMRNFLLLLLHLAIMVLSFFDSWLQAGFDLLLRVGGFLADKFDVFLKLLMSNDEIGLSLPLLTGFSLDMSTNSWMSWIFTFFIAIGVWFLLKYTWKRVVNNLASRREKYKACKIDLAKMIDEKNAHPILLRLAWSDAGTFDHTVKSWPARGGCNGSIRFDSELEKPVNRGLNKAIALLEDIKVKYPSVSWADLIQMAGAQAVESAGGPKIAMIYGRKDATFEQEGTYVQAELPSATWPYPDGAPSAQVHIRNIFYRMGFTNREIVALCGAHTLGRAFEDRTGVSRHSSGDQGATNYTRLTCFARRDDRPGVGMPGGCSWTQKWLSFDNSYYRRMIDNPHDPDLLWLPTDKALYECPEFRPFFETYAKNEQVFFDDYAKAHVKMATLGVELDPKRGFTLD